MIHTYKTEFPIYALSWSQRADKPFRLALGSYVELQANKIQVVQLETKPNGVSELVKRGEVDHSYPATKIMWIPDRTGKYPDLFATSGEQLSIFECLPTGGVQRKLALSNVKNSDFGAPLTAFDWHDSEVNQIGTASIDTTCTIWNVETGQARTQLIAHDREVFDMAFAQNPAIFASVGADGSLRQFDLRSLDHSTIMYESQDSVPLLRVAWNKIDPNYLATFMMDSQKLLIIDTRNPGIPVAELSGHSSPINSFAWAPHSSCHVCTAADDMKALVWDISTMRSVMQEPTLEYKTDSEVNNLIWSPSQPDWVSIAYDNKIQALRV